jgi:hypothetical protein
MNAIHSFEAEYNVQSFFQDLPRLREKTFTKRTIKHSFQNAGVWPLSFQAVKKKLKEYGKKRKRDTRLEFLEYGSESGSESETEREPDPVPDSQLQEEYQLPQLPKPPFSYNECRLQLQEINPKIMEALSSSPRKRYKVIRDGTDEFLMRGSLHEMEITQARAGQIATHKAKLNTRQSLGKGGSILAIEALDKIKVKTRKDAEEKLRKAKAKITRVENKAKEDLRVLGVAARKAEKERLWFITQYQGILSAHIPPEKWIPVRDPQKDPTPTKREALHANQSLYDELARVQQEYNTLQSEDPILFTNIPIDPAILAEEQQFKAQ